jgi:predicted site-specific integrase-resolvase
MDERSKEEENSLRASRSTLLSSFNTGGISKLIKVNIFENYTSHRVIELKQIIESIKTIFYAFVVSIPSFMVSVSASL